MNKTVGMLIALAVAAGLAWGGWLVYRAAKEAVKPQDSASPGASSRAVPVTAMAARTLDVPVQFATFGTVVAHSTVAVKTEVTGTLVKVHFQKGQDIRKGDLLFQIDPRPFEAAVAQAEAAVAQAEASVAQSKAAVAQAEGTRARDQAQLANAQRILVRQADMLKKGVAPQADYDKALADADALAAAVQADDAAVLADQAFVKAGEAAVRADEAALQNVKLQLDHCTIRSPLDGKAGNLLVDEGNVVTASETTLVSINQVSPIDVFFSIPQKDLPTVRKYMAERKLQVRVLFPPEEGAEETGELTFIDNSMDKLSGTIQLGATFENKDERLWPGQYVNLAMVLTIMKDAIVVPAAAIQVGRDGKYVFVVNKDGRADMKAVTVGPAAGDDVVVTEGVAVGDEVVTEGQFQIVPGGKVEVKGKKPEGNGPGDVGAKKETAS